MYVPSNILLQNHRNNWVDGRPYVFSLWNMNIYSMATPGNITVYEYTAYTFTADMKMRCKDCFTLHCTDYYICKLNHKYRNVLTMGSNSSVVRLLSYWKRAAEHLQPSHVTSLCTVMVFHQMPFWVQV